MTRLGRAGVRPLMPTSLLLVVRLKGMPGVEHSGRRASAVETRPGATERLLSCRVAPLPGRMISRRFSGLRGRAGALQSHRISKHVPLGAEVRRGAID